MTHLLILLSALLFTNTQDILTEPSSIYDIEINDIFGDKLDLASLKGKKILFVNVASKCGYTPQYKELQEVNEMFGDKVVVIGCPSNDFGAQEPGTGKEIVEFCSLTYGADFTLTEKVGITENTHPLYQWLTQKDLNGVADNKVGWNFCKFLINEDGTLDTFYPSKVLPNDEKIIAWIKG